MEILNEMIFEKLIGNFFTVAQPCADTPANTTPVSLSKDEQNVI